VAEDRKQSHRENQKAYVQRMRDAGYHRICVWVPDDAAVQDRIKDYIAKQTKKWLREQRGS
jgi:phospholipase/lecithinase/hemolysin